MVVPRDAWVDCLYSTHNLSYLHCVDAIQIPPWKSGSITPPNTAIPFSACWFKDIYYDSGRCTCPSGLKNSKQVELKVMRPASQNVPSWSLEAILSGTIHFSTPWFLDMWILAMGETVPYTGQWFKVYTDFWRTMPQISRLLPPNWQCNCDFKGHSIFLPASLDGGESVNKTSESHNHEHTVALLWLWNKFFGQKQYCIKYHDVG